MVRKCSTEHIFSKTYVIYMLSIMINVREMVFLKLKTCSPMTIKQFNYESQKCNYMDFNHLQYLVSSNSIEWNHRQNYCSSQNLSVDVHLLI